MIAAPAINRTVIAGLVDDRPRRRMIDGRQRVSVTVVIIRRRRDENGLRRTHKTRLVIACWDDLATQAYGLTLNQRVIIRGRLMARPTKDQRRPFMLIVEADEIAVT